MPTTIALSADDDAYYQSLIDQLFAGKADADVFAADDKTLQQNIKKLLGGVQEGYNKKLSEIDYDSIDHEMLKAMERNVYEFSCAKNYQQMKALNDALRDGDRIKTFAEFKKDAETILNDYNIRHLQTEYNHAVAASQMCAKWQAFPAGALLQYITVGDDRVRATHADIDGVVATKESDFWDTYYPPIDWNCRCNCIEVLDELPTDLTKLALPKVPGIFQPNVGKYGTVYDQDSSYFKGVPTQVLKNAVFRMPRNHQFKVEYKSVKGVSFKIHHVLNKMKGDGFADGLIAGNAIADLGYNIEFLPNNLIGKNKQIVFENWDRNSDPDFRINGEYYDLKTIISTNQSAIKNSIEKAIKKKQTEKFVIKLKDSSYLDWLKYYCKENVELENLIVVINNKATVLK